MPLEESDGTNCSNAWARWRDQVFAEYAAAALLVFVVLLIHAGRLTALPLRGEESRRGRVAVEMLESGDWVVPRQQGEPFLSRPPLQNWLIALAGLLRGDVDVAAVRWPSVIAVTLTAVLVFWYAKAFLSIAAAFAAGMISATFGQVLELGGLGETESVFMFSVAASLLFWHGLRLRGISPWVYWPIAYAMVGLGLLTKGVQAPVFFALAVGAYLWWNGSLRELLRLPHVIGGGAALLAVWGPWQWLFWRSEGWAAVRALYSGDVAMRFEDMTARAILAHLGTFPLEVFAGCLLPWSLILAGCASRALRSKLFEVGLPLAFVVLAVMATFPTCWLPPGARGRYFMPIYPCIAVLIASIVEQSATMSVEDGSRDQFLSRVWRLFLGAVAIVALVAAAAAPWGIRNVMDPPGIAVVSGLTMLAGIVAFWASRIKSPWRSILWGILASAGFAAVLWNGPVVEWKIAMSEQATPAVVAEVRGRLPPEAELVSIGPTDHLFAFYYRKPIRLVRWEQIGHDDFEYFCYSTQFSESPPLKELPFKFEVLSVVSCERQKLENPQRVVIVARRVNGRSTTVAEEGTLR